MFTKANHFAVHTNEIIDLFTKTSKPWHSKKDIDNYFFVKFISQKYIT